MIDIIARREPWARGVQLLVTQTIGQTYGEAKPLEFAAADPTEMRYEPTVRLTMDAAQRLMDELWNCGLRPTEGSGSAGAMAATQKHLEDMRRIAIGLLRTSGTQIDK